MRPVSYAYGWAPGPPPAKYGPERERDYVIIIHYSYSVQSYLFFTAAAIIAIQILNILKWHAVIVS